VIVSRFLKFKVFNIHRKLVQETLKIYGKIDMLILCAGVNAHFEFLNLEDTSVF